MERGIVTVGRAFLMKVTISKNPALDDDYVDVKYRELNSAVSRIIEICREGKQTMLVALGEKKYQIDVNDIFYVEWVDGHSCICTKENVYTSPQTLAQLAEQLGDKEFVRISKPMIVNIRKVKWISSVMNMKMMAELTNGERVVISRHYREDMLKLIFAIGKEMKNEKVNSK
jgi:DNA-binding LytR/AlgR family response regulator